MQLTADDIADLIVDAVDRAVAPLLTRLAVAEAGVVGLADVRDRVARLDSVVALVAPLGDSLATIRERIATLETRAPVPGPAGADGKDGADGFGFDDLTVTRDGDRGVVFTFAQGDRVRAFPLTVPWLVYRGVFVAGTSYTPGDVVTWAGSAWICDGPTTAKPGDGDGWTLAVKRGRDGRDAPPRKT
jgi:hypothetical protein